MELNMINKKNITTGIMPVQTDEEYAHMNTLLDTLKECSKIRGCYPLANRSQAEFIEWLVLHKSNDLLPLLDEFKQYCEHKYGVA